MSHVNAWILDFGLDYRAAIGARELLHLIDVPVAFAVPCTPEYCHKVLFWQTKLLPLMDVASRLGTAARDASFVAVVGYQQQRGDYPQFGALQLASPPVKVAVSDEQACQLPDEEKVWEGLAISCFEYQGTAIPILNVNRIFGAP